MQTGLYRINHGLDSTELFNYYKFCRKGHYGPKLFDAGTSQDHGPYEFDLALRLGLQLVAANPADATGLALLAQTTVPSTSQGNVVGRSNSNVSTITRNGYNTTTGRFDGTIGRGDSDDDLQARTGCKATWLSQAGVHRIGIFGKNQNGTGTYVTAAGAPFTTADATGTIPYARTTRFVPPAYTDFCCVILDDQNHTDMPTCELFDATNPGSGHGAVGENYEYVYRYPITAYSWAAGEFTITFTNPNTNANMDTLIAVGDEIGIDECGSDAWNFGALFVSSIVSQNSSGGVVKATGSNPGGSAGDLSVARMCPHKMFAEQVIVSKMIAAFDTIEDDESFLFQYGSRMPHAALSGTGAINNAEKMQASKRYELDGYKQVAIDYTEFGYWNGEAGEISPAVDVTTATVAREKNWAQRQHMLADANDAIVRLLDYMDARFGPDGYIVILTTDNGYQVGEQGGAVGGESTNVWARIGGKIYVYDGSERLFMWMRHPQYAPQVSYIPVFVGDLAPTNMDLFANNVQFFGLRKHHCHNNRDAKSLLRLLDDAGDADHDRLMFGMGIYKNSDNNDGLWVYDPQTQYKLLRSNSSPSTRALYDMTPDPASPVGASDDWETDNLDLGAGVAVADDMSVALDVLKKAGWSTADQANTFKSVRV